MQLPACGAVSLDALTFMPRPCPPGISAPFGDRDQIPHDYRESMMRIIQIARAAFGAVCMRAHTHSSTTLAYKLDAAIIDYSGWLLQLPESPHHPSTHRSIQPHHPHPIPYKIHTRTAYKSLPVTGFCSWAPLKWIFQSKIIPSLICFAGAAAREQFSG